MDHSIGETSIGKDLIDVIHAIYEIYLKGKLEHIDNYINDMSKICMVTCAYNSGKVQFSNNVQKFIWWMNNELNKII